MEVLSALLVFWLPYVCTACGYLEFLRRVFRYFHIEYRNVAELLLERSLITAGQSDILRNNLYYRIDRVREGRNRNGNFSGKEICKRL